MIKTKRISIMIGMMFVVILMLISTTYAIYTNYNTNNINGFSPGNQIDAYNQYQIDAEAANLFGPGTGIVGNAVSPFQEWDVATWPYTRVAFPGAGMNGIWMPPGGWAQWDLWGPFNPGAVDQYPEVRWGVYEIQLVLVTTDGGDNFGPNFPVDIDITIDGIWQYQGTVWSRVPANQHTVHDANNQSIIIDFHLNSGQNAAPTWLGQPIRPAPNDQHTIRIANNLRSQADLWLDEFHLSPV